MAGGFHKLMIANRGEVAVRIARACDDLGITPVFAVSAADANAPYTRAARRWCSGPPAPASPTST